jgi:hypothetical protein
MKEQKYYIKTSAHEVFEVDILGIKDKVCLTRWYAYDNEEKRAFRVIAEVYTNKRCTKPINVNEI